MSVDSENRIYRPKINYKKTIFDIDDLKILNSANVSFQDCIFMGSLRVGSKGDEAPIKILFDTVSIKKELYVSGAFNISNCNLSCINSPALYILNNNSISELSISHCRLGVAVIYNSKIDMFNGIFNKIAYFETSHSEFDKVGFQNGQIDITNFAAKSISRSKKAKIKKRHKYLVFHNSVNDKKLSREERFKVANETYSFLLKFSDYHLNRREKARLKYVIGLSTVSNPIMRLVYRIFGGLIVPYRIVLLMLIAIFAFSAIYYFSGAYFSIANTTRTLSTGEAIYFSGISFTTIGYGDIAPISILRYISILEGIIGILLSSAFLISLTRKYID